MRKTEHNQEDENTSVNCACVKEIVLSAKSLGNFLVINTTSTQQLKEVFIK